MTAADRAELDVVQFSAILKDEFRTTPADQKSYGSVGGGAALFSPASFQPTIPSAITLTFL
jgi:hypothetical protein